MFRQTSMHRAAAPDGAGAMLRETPMTDVVSFPIATWHQECSAAEQQQAIVALEAGNVLLFPQLRFAVEEDEIRLLSESASGQDKNVSLTPATGALRGSDADESERNLLQKMMGRFAADSSTLIRNLLPR